MLLIGLVLACGATAPTQMHGQPPGPVYYAHAKEGSPEWIVNQLEEASSTWSPSEPYFQTPRLRDLWRSDRVAKLLLATTQASDKSIHTACELIDKHYGSDWGIPFPMHLVGTVWLLLLYSPPPDKQLESIVEFDRYHYPLYPKDDRPWTYDFPWTITPSGRWTLEQFGWRLQGGFGNMESLYEAFSKLPRRRRPSPARPALTGKPNAHD